MTATTTQFAVTILEGHGESGVFVYDAPDLAGAYALAGEEFPQYGFAAVQVEADQWGTYWCHHRQTWVSPAGWRNINREELQAFLRDSDSNIATMEDFARLA